MLCQEPKSYLYKAWKEDNRTDDHVETGIEKNENEVFFKMARQTNIGDLHANCLQSQSNYTRMFILKFVL